MNDYTKRAVAYIAGRAVNNQEFRSLYDYNALKHFYFTGDNGSDVSIFDEEQKCLINGWREGNAFILYHSGNRKNIYLEIDNHNFKGYDYDSNSRFGGSINESSISIYDYDQNHRCDYLLC